LQPAQKLHHGVSLATLQAPDRRIHHVIIDAMNAVRPMEIKRFQYGAAADEILSPKDTRASTKRIRWTTEGMIDVPLLYLVYGQRYGF